MRKLLLTASILGLAAVPAFAFEQAPQGFIAAGDINLNASHATSNAGVTSTQGTVAGALVGGNGGVTVGAVSGNYTSMQTTAIGKASPLGSYTNTTAKQVNVGGTVVGGNAANKGFGLGSTGIAGGTQNSQATGNAAASATNLNLGGFIKVQPQFPTRLD